MSAPESQAAGFPWRRLLISLPVAIAAAWFVLRDARMGEIGEAFASLAMGPLLISLACMVLLVALRTWRWVLMVRAVSDTSFAQAARISTIGFAAIDLFPVRLGEFVRPLLLQSRANVPFGAGTATIVVERLMDLVALLAFLLGTLALAELPPLEVAVMDWSIDLAVQGRNAVITLILIGGVPPLVLVAGGERGLRILEHLSRPLPRPIRELGLGLAAAFVDGGRRIGQPGVLVACVVLSLVAWGFNLLVLWQLAEAFGLGLDLPASSIVMCVVAVGLLMPSPAGGLGTFEAAGKAGVMIYGVVGSQAAAFAIALHFLHVGVIVLIGGVSLVIEGVGLGDLLPKRTEAAEAAA